MKETATVTADTAVRHDPRTNYCESRNWCSADHSQDDAKAGYFHRGAGFVLDVRGNPGISDDARFELQIEAYEGELFGAAPPSIFLELGDSNATLTSGGARRLAAKLTYFASVVDAIEEAGR